MQKINNFPKDKEDFLFGFNLSPVRKNEKVVFNSYYKNEGEIWKLTDEVLKIENKYINKVLIKKEND